MFHDFPGNIRELENIIEHAFGLCREGRIGIDCLPENMRISAHRPAGRGSMATTVQSAQTQVILDTLERNNYSRLATARELGIHKSTLFRKINTLNIELPEKRDRVHLKKNGSRKNHPTG